MVKVKQEKQKKKISGNYSQTVSFMHAASISMIFFLRFESFCPFFLSSRSSNKNHSRQIASKPQHANKKGNKNKILFVVERWVRATTAVCSLQHIIIFGFDKDIQLSAKPISPIHTHSLHAIVQQIWTHLNNIQKKIISLMVFIRIAACCFYPTHFWVNWICLQTKPYGLEWKINSKYKDNKTRMKTFQLLAVGI